MRKNLKILRTYKELTQAEFARKIGYSPVEYQYIESGKRNPHAVFWKELQRIFRLDDEAVKELQKNE